MVRWPASACGWCYLIAPSSGKWHAATVPLDLIVSGGSSVAHISCAFQQRVRKRQPDGGLSGVGTSPSSRMRPEAPILVTSGTADSSARVYGWDGRS